MSIPKTVGLFLATAVAEIIGCYLPYLWLRHGRSIWLLGPATVSLAAGPLGPHRWSDHDRRYGDHRVRAAASVIWIEISGTTFPQIIAQSMRFRRSSHRIRASRARLPTHSRRDDGTVFAYLKLEEIFPC